MVCAMAKAPTAHDHLSLGQRPTYPPAGTHRKQRTAHGCGQPSGGGSPRRSAGVSPASVRSFCPPPPSLASLAVRPSWPFPGCGPASCPHASPPSPLLTSWRPWRSWRFARRGRSQVAAPPLVPMLPRRRRSCRPGVLGVLGGLPAVAVVAVLAVVPGRPGPIPASRDLSQRMIRVKRAASPLPLDLGRDARPWRSRLPP